MSYLQNTVASMASFPLGYSQNPARSELHYYLQSLQSGVFTKSLPFLCTSPPRTIHYYLQSAETNPDTAPLVLWLNGGPGSSSLFGMFTEVGQLVFNAESLKTNTTVAPRLFYNPEGW